MSARHDIVLLHGWASHPSIFRGLARVLERHAHVTMMPLPGYGDSVACTPYTLEHIADTLANAAPKSCSVVGWSLGAQVALAWARRAPKQVERLVLVGATPCFVQRGQGQNQGQNAWPHGVTPMVMRQFTSQLERDAAALLRRFVALQAQGDKQAVRVAHKLRTALFTHALPAPAVLIAGLEILRTSDLRGDLSSIAQPALVMHGENDAVVPCAAGEALAATLPRARFEKISDAGHAPFLAVPDAIGERLLAFFNESHAAIR